MSDTPHTGNDGQPVVTLEMLETALATWQATHGPTNADAAANGTGPADVHDAARYYVEHGQAPIPLPFRSKKPVLDSRPGLRLTADTLDQYFPPGEQLNDGRICGRLSKDADGGEVVVDLDCPEALRART